MSSKKEQASADIEHIIALIEEAMSECDRLGLVKPALNLDLAWNQLKEHSEP